MALITHTHTHTHKCILKTFYMSPHWTHRSHGLIFHLLVHVSSSAFRQSATCLLLNSLSTPFILNLYKEFTRNILAVKKIFQCMLTKKKSSFPAPELKLAASQSWCWFEITATICELQIQCQECTFFEQNCTKCDLVITANMWLTASQKSF